MRSSSSNLSVIYPSLIIYDLRFLGVFKFKSSPPLLSMRNSSSSRLTLSTFWEFIAFAILWLWYEISLLLMSSLYDAITDELTYLLGLKCPACYSFFLCTLQCELGCSKQPSSNISFKTMLSMSLSKCISFSISFNGIMLYSLSSTRRILGRQSQHLLFSYIWRLLWWLWKSLFSLMLFMFSYFEDMSEKLENEACFFDWALNFEFWSSLLSSWERLKEIWSLLDFWYLLFFKVDDFDSSAPAWFIIC